MTETESLIAEVRQLRVEVARLHAAHTAVHIRHGWMGMLLKDLNLATHYGAMSAAEAAFGEPTPPPIPLEPQPPLPSV